MDRDCCTLGDIHPTSQSQMEKEYPFTQSKPDEPLFLVLKPNSLSMKNNESEREIQLAS